MSEIEQLTNAVAAFTEAINDLAVLIDKLLRDTHAIVTRLDQMWEEE